MRALEKKRTNERERAGEGCGNFLSTEGLNTKLIDVLAEQ